MTKQETYDIIVAHLRKQGERAEDRNGNCLYRTAGGLKCAAGCLIPDDEYDAGMEMKLASKPIVADVLHRHGHNVKLVGAMQSVHDDYELDEWEFGFQDVAKRFDLVYTPPEAR